MIVDMCQTPGFEQKETRLTLKNDENAGPYGCFLFDIHAHHSWLSWHLCQAFRV